jgi:butyrate kinase
MARDEDLIKKIKKACEWIAPIFFYPGEFEMEAMANGAIRVLEGTEKAKKYQGKSCFQGFPFERMEV